MDVQMIGDQIINFTTVFLGIFIEAAPFLLLGTVASGLVEVFVSREELTRLIPRNALLATLFGGLMGFAFPVCECGVVPLTRRLFRKGMPIPAGITFLLAAPIINPVVIASTFAAYGFGTVLIARLAMGLIVALGVGLVFSMNKTPLKMMRPQTMAPIMGGVTDAPAPARSMQGSVRERIQRAFRIAADEFFEMGRYLIIGSVLAALMQTIISQNTLLALGSGPLISVILMQVLAYVLSVCSTVDAFVSLAFTNTFTTGSVLSFLVFGPMVDIKSTLMFLGVFRRKYVAYLIVLPFLMTLLLSVFINLNVNW
jgi:uncharacterized membrane protein YraQ (UPF0718 family)